MPDLDAFGFEEVLELPVFDEVKYVEAKRKAVTLASAHALSELRQRTPVRSGQTRGRLSFRVTEGPGITEGMVGGKSIADDGFNILYGLEFGTGLFGPRKQRIRPTTKKALSWIAGATPVSGSGGQRITVRSTAGMKPRRPFARTHKEAGDRIFRTLAQALQRELL